MVKVVETRYPTGLLVEKGNNGKTLHFAVEVTAVREATTEELDQGHVTDIAA